MESSRNWKTGVLAIGAVIGLAAGLGAAYLVIRRSEEGQGRPRLTTGDGMKIGMSLASVLKLVSDISAPKSS